MNIFVNRMLQEELSGPGGPTTLPWVKYPILVRDRYRNFRRWLRKDKTIVACVEDLEEPPPAYQAVRREPPADSELYNLQYELSYYHSLVYVEEGLERQLLYADIEYLHRWIVQLEYLTYWTSATTIPARYRHEPIKDRIIKGIRRLRAEFLSSSSPSDDDDDDEFLEDEMISLETRRNETILIERRV
ncbi:hypothetical protein J3E69DRAFT_351567 [Trichoderma sp. SZMC 28015]